MTNGVHASVPANGRLIARIGDTAIEIESPPAVAAIRSSPSFREEQETPSAGKDRFRTISARSPPPQPNTTTKPRGDESHPL